MRSHIRKTRRITTHRGTHITGARPAHQSLGCLVGGEAHIESVAVQPIETRGCVAEYDTCGEHLTIWDTTQAAVSARGLIAAKLGMAEADVTVIAPDVGGSLPGSFNPRAVDCYSEGLRIPPMRIFKNDELDKTVMRRYPLRWRS